MGSPEYSLKRASFSSANSSLLSCGQSGHRNLPSRILWPPEMCSSKNSLVIGSPLLYLYLTRISWNLMDSIWRFVASNHTGSGLNRKYGL